MVAKLEFLGPVQDKNFYGPAACNPKYFGKYPLWEAYVGKT